MKTYPWSYQFPDGTKGCIMAYNKAHAIQTIKEFYPDQLIQTLTLYLEPEWTSNPLCESRVGNTYHTRRN
jgi:hypothetical protein